MWLPEIAIIVWIFFSIYKKEEKCLMLIDAFWTNVQRKSIMVHCIVKKKTFTSFPSLNCTVNILIIKTTSFTYIQGQEPCVLYPTALLI